MAYRLIKGALKLIVALVVLAVVAAGYLFYRAMPTYSGRQALAGLSAEVHVWRDDYGIPHIFANDMNDATRALGYLHASERLYQMQMSRWVGQGRIAEIVGPDMLGVDKFLRTLGFYRLPSRASRRCRPTPRRGFRPTRTASTPTWIRMRTRCRSNSCCSASSPNIGSPPIRGLGRADGVGI